MVHGSEIIGQKFNSDHLHFFYYKEDGCKGFSDYSIVGQEYSETGFAPTAVA